MQSVQHTARHRWRRQVTPRASIRQCSMAMARTGPGGGCLAVLLIFRYEEFDGRGRERTSSSNVRAGPVDAHPPERRPVLVVVVHQEGGRAVGCGCSAGGEDRTWTWAWRGWPRDRLWRQARTNTGRDGRGLGVDRARCPILAEASRRRAVRASTEDCIDLPVEQVVGPIFDTGVPELRHGLGLDLTDAFPGEVEVPADLLQGPRRNLVEPKSQPDDRGFALVQRREEAVEISSPGGTRRRSQRRNRIGIRNQITEVAVALVAERL